MRYNKKVEHNLAARLRSALDPAEWDLLQQIANAAEQLNLPLYVVGGAPRDLLLGKPVSDFDLVVEGPARVLAERLRDTYGGKVTLHGKFGTAKWETKGSNAEGLTSSEPASGAKSVAERTPLGHAVDLVTARSETYRHPAALPTVEPGTIKDDLGRRDFTINALAIRLDAPHTGEVRDDFGAWQDIEAGVVRVLHDGSFIDDPTRMPRAVRYEQRYAFRIAEHTAKLIPAALAVVEKLSAQRIRHELDLILDEPRAASMLARLHTLGLLMAIDPALSFDDGSARRVNGTESGSSLSLPDWPVRELRWLCWLMALGKPDIENVNKRLHFAAPLFKALLAAAGLWSDLESLAGSAPSRWVARLDQAPLVAVHAVYLASRPGPVRVALEQYLGRWRYIKPRTTGHELRRLGIMPGAAYKEILGELRQAWLDGKVHTEQEEGEYLRTILARRPGKQTG